MISIIIATYNAAATLQKCLDSIRSQKAQEVELLVIDGLSSDNTMEIVAQNRDIINIAVSEKDNGLYDAWNKGIVRSKGDWILFIGADDVLEDGAISAYQELIELNADKEFDYISANVNYIDNNGRIIKTLGSAWDWNVFQKKMNVAHVASLHNKRLFDEIGLFDLNYKICADYELLLRKRDKLRALFMPVTVASMQMGGVSFTTKAIDETCRIVSATNNFNSLQTTSILIAKYIQFYLFRLLRITLK